MRYAADRQQKTLRPEGWVRRVRAAAGSAVVGCAPTKYDDLLHATHSNPSPTPPDARLTYWIAGPLLGHGLLRSRPISHPVAQADRGARPSARHASGGTGIHGACEPSTPPRPGARRSSPSSTCPTPRRGPTRSESRSPRRG